MKDTNNQGKSFQERLAEAEERRKNATISDIIAAKRREADSIEASARGSFKAGEDWDERPFTESDLESALDLAETKRKEADRLEAAHRRERGDAAELREALRKINSLCGIGVVEISSFEIGSICDAALAAPPRNCDKYPTFNDAIRALADKRGWHDAKWDSERYCILAQWLFAPATEKEGGGK